MLLVLALAVVPVRGAFAGLNGIQIPDSGITAHAVSMADMSVDQGDMQMMHDCCKKQQCEGCQDTGSSCDSCVIGHIMALDTLLLSLDHFHDPVPPSSRKTWRIQFPDLLDRPPLPLI